MNQKTIRLLGAFVGGVILGVGGAVVNHFVRKAPAKSKPQSKAKSKTRKSSKKAA